MFCFRQTWRRTIDLVKNFFQNASQRPGVELSWMWRSIESKASLGWFIMDKNLIKCMENVSK